MNELKDNFSDNKWYQTICEKEMQRLNSLCESLRGRVEKLEKDHVGVSGDIQVIRSLCNEMREDLKDLKDRPGHKWERLSFAIIQWLVLAILAGIVIFK